MRQFARIVEGMVFEIFPYDGDVNDIMPMYEWIDVTDANPMPDQSWTWDGETFSPPLPPYVDPRPPIFAELEQIDRESARPLRVLVVADPNIGLGTPERAELEALELRAADLRAQLDALPPPP